MHRCLTIDEILTRIMSHMVPRWPKVLSDWEIQRLTAVALTCKTFYQPAVAASWASLVGLERLMHTFPDGVVSLDVTPWALIRTPLPSEWDRFSHYARCVRHLNLHEDHGVSTTTLEEFAGHMKSQFGDAPAFSNLRSFHSHWHYMKNRELLTLFLQPGLETFNVNLREEVERGIVKVTSLAPNIQSMNIQHLFINELLLLSPLHRLQSLNCSIQAKPSATALDQLQTLSGVVFPALKAVEFHFWEPLSFCTGVISWLLVSAPNLNELYIRCAQFKAAPDAVEQFVAAFAAFKGRLTKCSLRMRQPTDNVLIPAHDILSQLQSLGGALYILDLCDVVLALKEDDLVAIARACPKLVGLCLGDKMIETVSSVPVTALEEVAACCPDLEYLGIPLTQGEEHLPRPTCLHPTLRELRTRSILYQSSASRKFASRLFPWAHITPEPFNPYKRVVIRDC